LLSGTEILMQWVETHRDLELITPDQSGRYAGIVTFRHRQLDPAGHADLYRRLMKAGIVCANRAGGIRLSPHFYTDVDALMPCWEQVCSKITASIP